MVFGDGQSNMYAGCKVSILGDLNFRCSAAYCGFRIFDDFAASLGLVSCDDMVRQAHSRTCIPLLIKNYFFIIYLSLGY